MEEDPGFAAWSQSYHSRSLPLCNRAADFRLGTWRLRNLRLSTHLRPQDHRAVWRRGNRRRLNLLWRQIGGWAVFILLAGFLIRGVNNWAHIGGMLGGALCALLLGYNERRRENQLHRLLAAACMLITAAVLLWSVFRGGLFLFTR